MKSGEIESNDAKQEANQSWMNCIPEKNIITRKKKEKKCLRDNN